ncbi:SulP family inorganic anion transporter [Pseudomonas sp. N040]|uniref:SulP family inorganic anion transporter n=1 Tax=Pseudomonas sp. N040 TaxID=2785325 RepID=UPI0018A2B1F9|nr:SulP family inorganic anion transporter [Pseudomonas sp. N040]MBF7729981.1 STAS domain-containing protein [Pseudomonas sp. N040]MBW7013623.1 STAS domain-containing protein [Pseudomonas sp. N040]
MLFWLRNYRRELLSGDLTAGIIVVLMLVPQGMAYALVAGLPPVAGLYASILPALTYALFGSSMVQSVGPMAITSLMTATSLASLAPAGSALYSAMAAQMALIAGVVLLLCGIFRLGFLSNFLSRPVMSGFTCGAAIIIAVSQLKTLLGGSLSSFNLPGASIGAGSLLLLWLARNHLPALLKRLGLPAKGADILSKLAPALTLLLAILVIVKMGWLGQVALVGPIPAGLPGLGIALSLEQLRSLLLPALLIGFMIFLSGQSAAVTLAQKRNERINTDQELLGLGAANLASAVSGGFPVTGSISRSAVNQAAGANTPLATLVTAGLLAIILCVPTGWLALLPLPALAATIIIAVLGMLDFDTPRLALRHDRGDALAWLATLAGVLLLGVEEGVVLGLILSLGTVIARASRPHIAILGRLPGTEHFRNVERYPVETLPHLLMLRIDAGLFFGNAEVITGQIMHAVQPATRQVLLVMSAVNQIDTTGLYALVELNRNLARQGIQLHMSEVKGQVMDRLQHSSLLLQNLSGKVFLSTAAAFSELFDSAMHAPDSRRAAD